MQPIQNYRLHNRNNLNRSSVNKHCKLLVPNRIESNHFVLAQCSSLIIRLHRSTVYVAATYCYRLSIARSVCHSSEPAKTAEPIEMSFGLRIHVGPKNHALDGSPHPPMGRGNFEAGRGGPL